MADNVQASAAVGEGAVFRTDEDVSGGGHVPYSKLMFGADGTFTIVTASAGLPVAAAQSGTWMVDLGATDNAVLDSIAAALAGTLTVGTHAVTQSGTWTVELGATDNAVLDAIAASLAGTLTVGLPSGASTSANQATIIGHLDGVEALLATIDGDTGALAAALKVDDDAFTPATDKVLPIGAMFDDSAPDSVNEGDVGIPRMSANRNIYLQIRDAAGNERGANVDKSGNLAVAATQSGVWDVAGDDTHDIAISTQFFSMGGRASAAAPSDVSDDDDGVMMWHLRNGSPVVNVAVGGALVTGSAGLPVAQQGTWTVGLSAAQTLSTVTTVSTLTGGGVAHDTADSGNPHKIGAKATNALSGLTLVANSDRTDLFAGLDGVQITRPHANLEDIVSGVAAITDGSSTSVIAAAGSGVKIYITSVVIRNSSATDVGVDLRDGAAGAVKATFPAPPNGGGCVHNLPVPLPFSANTAVCADPSAAASTVTVTLVGFKSKV